VKGVQLEGIRGLGDPAEFARAYYEEGADELLFVDVVASLYGRNSLLDMIRSTAREIFCPLAVGGGIRNLDHVQSVLRSGADKVCVNTAALMAPAFITRIAEHFGSSTIVVNIEAKQRDDGRWEALTNSGRDTTGRDAVEWAEEAVACGAGEILLTSIDRDGTGRGLDLELVRGISARVPVPVIASGGVGSVNDFRAGFDAGASAVAAASVFHYHRLIDQETRSHHRTPSLDPPADFQLVPIREVRRALGLVERNHQEIG